MTAARRDGAGALPETKATAAKAAREFIGLAIFPIFLAPGREPWHHQAMIGPHGRVAWDCRPRAIGTKVRARCTNIRSLDRSPIDGEFDAAAAGRCRAAQGRVSFRLCPYARLSS